MYNTPTFYNKFLRAKKKFLIDYKCDVCAKENLLTETVLLSTQNLCYLRKLMINYNYALLTIDRQ